MYQNFSKMPNIYIPELIELDSYWQKAVKDAIYDTLKGEKRLYYALKNRKKINDKLEKLGLKPLFSQMNFSKKCDLSSRSLESRQDNYSCVKRKWASSTDWDSPEENSDSSSLMSAQDETSYQKVVKLENPSFSPIATKSASKERKDTPPEKMYRNPERPILGNGSLEKMKKSQNSFYCEPMGKEEDEKVDGQPDIMFEDQSKRVKWLHMRKNTAFKDSDTEPSNNPSKEIVKSSSEKMILLEDEVVDSVSRSRSRVQGTHLRDIKLPAEEQVPMTLDPQEDLFWEKEVKNAIRKNAEQERKLYFALAKREIVNKNLKKICVGKNSREIKINVSEDRLTAKRKQGKKVLSPYLRFYLEVYGKLCHKAPIQKIAKEVATRWWQKSLKQKSKFQR